MITATKPAKSLESAIAKAKARPLTVARIVDADAGVITINDVYYDVRLESDDDTGRTISVQEITGTAVQRPTYYVVCDETGESYCDCPDWQYRSELLLAASRRCKHQEALAIIGAI